MHDVFISYHSRDRSLAEELRDRLVAEGFRVWFDKEKLEGGRDWYHDIKSALDDCRVVIPVLTPHWKRSEWTKFETYAASCVIPVLFSGEFRARTPENETDWEKSVATPPLSRIQFVDLSKNRADPAEWSKLLRDIRRELGRDVPVQSARFVRLRHDPNPRLVGRDVLLLEIHERMFHRRVSSYTQGHVEVVAGLGGTGKTALVREYVERFWRCYEHIVWVDVGHGLVAELADAHDRMHSDNAREQQTIEDKALSLLHFLKTAKDGRINLLIVDSADEEDATLPWLPLSGDCHVLITSSDAFWSAASFTLVPLGRLIPEAARTALLAAAKRATVPDSDENDNIEQVIRRLDGHPLALEVAGSYVHQQGEAFGFGDFLRVHEEAEKQQLERRTSGATEYPASVYAALRASVEKLSSGARMLLHLACYLAPAAIPLKLWLEARDVLQNLLRQDSTSPEPPEAGALTEAQLRTWKDELVRYSVIQPTDGGRSFIVHQMVRSIERLETHKNECDWVGRLLQVLRIAAPEAGHDVAGWDDWEKLLPHVKFACSQEHLPVAIPATLLMGMAGYLWAQGRYLEARRPASDALAACNSELDTSSLAQVRSIELMANVCRGLGDIKEAEGHFEQALFARMRLGVEDAELLAALGNYAGFLAACGESERALALFDKALAIARSICAEDDLAMLHLINNYACCLESIDRLEDARELFSKALSGYLRRGGPSGHEVLAARVSLACVLESLARQKSEPSRGALLSEAESQYQEALAAASGQVGPSHPVLLRCKQSLARLKATTGREIEGEALCREVLVMVERDTGPSSLETCTVVATLAEILDLQQRIDEAAVQYRRACEGFADVLGLHHSQTLHAMQAYGLMLSDAEKWHHAAEVLGFYVDGCMEAFSKGSLDAQGLQEATQHYAGALGQLGKSAAEIDADIRKRARVVGLVAQDPPT
jgi:tetratricopeptide (TPR) repeat protein